MSSDFELYSLKKSDIEKAGSVLAAAFTPDPVWKKVLQGIEHRKICSFFESPVRFGMKYGSAFATSEKLEGIAVWVPSSRADMTLWRGMRSGSMFSGMKIGMKTLKAMKEIFEPLEHDRKRHMAGREYNYVMIVGVAPEFQGQGFASKLLKAVISGSDTADLPLYLETSTEKNVAMYEHFGFRVIDKMMHPVIDLPQWEMLRDTSAKNSSV